MMAAPNRIQATNKPMRQRPTSVKTLAPIMPTAAKAASIVTTTSSHENDFGMSARFWIMENKPIPAEKSDMLQNILLKLN